MEPLVFTTADGQKFQVNLPANVDRNDLDAVQKFINENPDSVFVFEEKTAAQTQTAQAKNSVFAGTGLESGGAIKSRKEYKEMKKDLQQKFFDEIHEEGQIEDYKMKHAKKHAKGQVEVQKAADKVVSSRYFTPDQKEEYKKQKKELEKQGFRAVLLTKEDMQLLKDDDFVLRKLDDKGNITKEPILDENGNPITAFNADGSLNEEHVKLISAQRIGTDNELEMEERKAETEQLTASAEGARKVKNGKVTHKNARQAKNLYKHLGYDYQKDLTETKKAAVIVGSTLLGAGLGAAAPSALGTLKAANTVTTIGQGTKIITNNTVEKVIEYSTVGPGGNQVSIVNLPGKTTTTVTEQAGTVSTTSENVSKSLSTAKAAGAGALVGLGLGIGAASLMKSDLDKKNDILGNMEPEHFINNAWDKQDFKGVKKKRNQLMMQRMFDIAKEKGMDKATMLAMIQKAHGTNDCLTEKELLKLFNEVKNYTKPEEPPVVDPNQDDYCLADMDDTKIQEEVKIPNQPYKMQKGDRLDRVIAAKYGITDPSDLRSAIKAIRLATGIPENGKEDGKTVIPRIEVEGKTLADAYWLPESILDDKYKLDINAKVAPSKMVYGPGVAKNGQSNEATVSRTADGKVVTTCKGQELYRGTDVAKATKIRDEYNAEHGPKQKQ